jgi:hypothetical protein
MSTAREKYWNSVYWDAVGCGESNPEKIATDRLVIYLHRLNATKENEMNDREILNKECPSLVGQVLSSEAVADLMAVDTNWCAEYERHGFDSEAEAISAAIYAQYEQEWEAA